MRGVIDEAQAQARQFVNQAFVETLKLGPGGFEGYVDSAIKKAEKILWLMEAARMTVNLESGKNMPGSDNRMRALVFNRAVVATIRLEAERFSCLNKAKD